MPFVTIKILKGHPQERKDEISRRVTDGDQRARAAAQGSGLGGVRGRDRRGLVRRRRTSLAEERRASCYERRDPRPALRRGRRPRGRVRAPRRRLPVHRGPAVGSARPAAAVQRHPGRPHRPVEPRAGGRACSARRATWPTASRGIARAGCCAASTPRSRAHAHRARRHASPCSPAATRARSSTARTTWS